MVVLYPDLESEQKIKELVTTFCRLASKFSTQQILPYSKQLHLRLAYQFNPEQMSGIEELVHKNINYKIHGDWEIRLYSRDYRLDEKHVRN